MALTGGCQSVWTPRYCSIPQVAGSRTAGNSSNFKGIYSHSSTLSDNLHHRCYAPKVLPAAAASLRNAPINNARYFDHHQLRKKELLRTSFAERKHLFGKHEQTPKFSPRKPLPTRALLHPFISQAATDKTIQLPINYYQVLQADKLSLPEKIVRAYEARVREVPGDGAPYSKAALAAREELLLIARNLLVNSDARRSYNIAVQNNDVGLVEVPWSQLPGALALLQEVGEEEVVLEVGRAALAERPPSRVFKQDVILAMALSLTELAGEAVNETPPAFAKACEMLERALELLKEEGGKGFAVELQERIDTSLASLAPYCVLDLLAKPLDPAHAPGRKEGLTGVRELLAAMAEPESRWRRPDVMSRADFAEAAFTHMTAREQVELYKDRPSDPPASFPELLAAARAHIAQGFMERKPELVEDADAVLSKLERELQQDPDSADVQRYDVALERAMCCLLLGHVDDAKAHLGLTTSPPTGSLDIADYVYAHSESSPDLLPGLCSLLERWLREALLTSYQEASEIDPAITPYFEDPHVKAYLEKLQQGSLLLVLGKAVRGGVRLVARIASLPVRTLKWIGRGVEGLAAGLKDRAGAVNAATSGNGATEETRRGVGATENERPGRTGLAMESDLQSLRGGTATQSRGPVTLEAFDREGGDSSNGGVGLARGPPFLAPPEQLPRGIPAMGKLKDLDLERFLERRSDGFEESTAGESGDEMEGSEASGDLDSEMTVGALIERAKERGDVASVGAENNGAVSSKPKPVDPVYKNRSNVVILVGAALLVAAIASAVLKPSRKPAANQLLQTPVTAGTVASPPKPAQPQIIPKPTPVPVPDVEIRMPPMDSVLAEGIIRRWQKAKAGAMGRRGDISGLADVLDGAMLAEWTAKARSFEKAGKRWDYDLRGISVESVQVSNRGREAVVGVTLQERATEFDASQQPIDSYEDEYRAKYELRFIRGLGWRIVSGTVLN